MRRLVVISKDAISKSVISNKRAKAIAALAALVLSLTSIHLAAAARMETLKRQQEQLEQTTISAARSLLSRGSMAIAPTPKSQNKILPRPEPQSSPTLSKTAPQFPADPVAVARTRQIVISIADRQLAVLDHGQVIKIYAIAVGTPGTPSPDGEFVIINHAKDPTYRHGEKEIGPGKDNPLGSRWMGLSLKGYGIHGTNVQSSVGKALSHGCFRMRKTDVEELYSMVQVGDTVTIRREHDALVAQVFDAPVMTLAANNGSAAAAQGGELEMAAASERTTVETTEQ